MNIQYFTANNERFAILPANDLDGLLLDHDDVATANAIESKLSTGEEEAIPEVYAKRLIFGENPITIWREYRGLNQKTLAMQADISTGFLSRLEAEQTEASVKTLQRIAEVLKVSLDDLVVDSHVQRAEFLGDINNNHALFDKKYDGPLDTNCVNSIREDRDA